MNESFDFLLTIERRIKTIILFAEKRERGSAWDNVTIDTMLRRLKRFLADMKGGR